jgi:hypothetical protein
MGTPRATDVVDQARRRRIWLGVILLGAGLLGHLLAAQAIAGSRVPYRVAYGDHIFGFFILTLGSGALLAGLGWLFWRGRHDITLLVLGALQALFGLVIYIERFNV